ncbi:hypothetical protein [Pelagicoccus sp. SDUM812002]|uniref:hypothetical protein n=1 Tax=Pelagicoccus sp. SDUM812002 TaxID=3041266 RepID=UPI002810845D|nr:hypothetical protein [Pelagicoccus sp. SDUM812002]MDQ8186340.1 hypothetical protein [Pelagicoccus sp. SDUM812002]
MDLLFAYKRLPKTIALTFGVCLTPFLISQEINDDPWFEQQANRDATESVAADDTSRTQKINASPEKVYRSLIKELEKVPSYALTKRIELLKRAANSTAHDSNDTAKELEILEGALSEILTDIETAVNIPSLEEAVKHLSPHQKYFQADIQLSKQLLDSHLSARLEKALTEASNSGNLEPIASLQATIQSSGLSHIFGNRLKSTLEQSQSDLILRRWSSAQAQQPTSPSEVFLVRKVLGQEDARLPLSINILNHTDPRFQSSLQKSIARQLGNTIAPRFDSSADLSVTIDVHQFNLDQQIEEASIESVIPGTLEEQENPEFAKILATYKKQAERFELAYQRYERDHDDWIRNYKSDDGKLEKGIEDAEKGLEEANKYAQQNNNPFTGFTPEAQDRMDSAMLELQQARNMASSAQVQNRPEPIPPSPVHLDTLKKVYATPSVLVTESDSTEYTYTQQNILSTFQSEASLTLDSSNSPLPKKQFVELERDRKWIRNLGVDSRDPRPQQDDYSEEAIDSTRDLFYLEFASACASKLETLLESAGQAQLETGLTLRDRQALLLGLSLKASSQNLTLPEQERSRLFALADDPSISSLELENRLLESLLKVTFASSAEDLNKALEIIRQPTSS